MPPILYSERQISLIRESSRIVAECREISRELCTPGSTTVDIDRKISEHLKKCGATSPFYKYELPGKIPFPAVVCASVNDVVVHGTPDDVLLKEGDLVAIDIGVRKDGYIGDSAWTFGVGNIGPEKEKLLEVGRQSLYEGIAAMKPRGKLVELSKAIQNYVEANGFSVVRDYVGHGVGQSLHEEPQIPNYVQPGQNLPFFRTIFKPGMVVAVEPMVNAGSPNVLSTDGDWPVRTADGLPSVHFEHTLAIRSDRIEILTSLDGT